MKAPAARARRGITALTTAAVVMGSSSSVLACPVCFGAEETSVIEGTRLGILVLLSVTVAVQGGFAGFFLYLRRRATRNAALDVDAECREPQRRHASQS